MPLFDTLFSTSLRRQFTVLSVEERAGKLVLDLLALAAPRVDADLEDARTFQLVQRDRTVVAARLQVREVLVEQHLQGAFGLFPFDHRGAPEYHHAGILHAEFQRFVGGQQAPHVTHAETHLGVAFDVGAGAPDLRGMCINCLILRVIHEQVAVDKWLAFVDGGERANRRVSEHFGDPRLIGDRAIRAAHLIRWEGSIISGHRFTLFRVITKRVPKNVLRLSAK